jgi:hypothetical protein
MAEFLILRSAYAKRDARYTEILRCDTQDRCHVGEPRPRTVLHAIRCKFCHSFTHSSSILGDVPILILHEFDNTELLKFGS